MPEIEALAGRLDSVVARMTGAPRADVQRAIAAGRVRVNGRTRSKSHRLEGGELLEVDLQDEPLRPEQPPVPVRFQDEHLLILAKPADLPTHPTENRRTGTLINRLLGMGVTLARAGAPLRPGIVHRLDAGTSGLLIVAKTDEAHSALSEMFARHQVARVYLALVAGTVPNQTFVVEAPLARRASRIVVDRTSGRPSATEASVRERLEDATLLEIAPRTGRTHQIRVHLAAVGHPILGDRAYGGSGALAGRLGFTRPFLHSWRVRFEHPITGQQVSAEEPLPQDLRAALARLRRA
jgi:23S rRNA pseudouridine1911/1915/1917 synthase